MAIELKKQLLSDDKKIIFFCAKCGKELFVNRLHNDLKQTSKIISTCLECSSDKDTEVHLDKYRNVISKKLKRVDRDWLG